MEGAWAALSNVPEAVTLLEGIWNEVSPGVKVLYAKGPDIKRNIPSFFDSLTRGPKEPSQTP